MKYERSFNPQLERYHFDFGECAGDGWVQYDTQYDASYFGIWVNPERKQILTFAEGDITRQQCETDEEYHAELARMAEFYGDPPPAFTTISQDGTVTRYYDERPT